MISAGTPTLGPTGAELVDHATRAGFHICTYDGARCDDLAGTTNVPGAAARAAGAEFIHVEIADHIREDGSRLAGFNTAVIAALQTV